MSKDYVPNPKKHLIVSLIKSGLRLSGYALLWLVLPHSFPSILVMTVLLLSELLGVYEELV